MKTRHLVAAAALAMPLATTAAHAADAPPAAWADTLKIGAQIDAGIDANFASPHNNQNFGQLYTDRANRPVLNQALLSIGRPVDPKATDYDFGFKVQGMYGTDSRYIHYAYTFDHIKSQYQPAIMEASVTAFTPVLTEGGINWQAGLWPTLLGFETIDTSTNPFYSHSYIYNYGLPVNHAGFNAIVHATDALDVYVGLTAGNQTIFGYDNNHAVSYLGGVKYTFNDNFSILALTHYGPENAQKAFNSSKVDVTKYNRAFNDVIITYKASDSLTSTTELNYVVDDGFVSSNGTTRNAEAFGAAQYLSYAANDIVTFNARAEAFVDTRGFYVFGSPSSTGAVRALEGYSSPALSSFAGRSVYGALTLGATFKPTMPEKFSDITTLIRPEIRADRVISGPARFNNGADKTAITAAIDVVFTY
jgi:hypothetical protein